jgi:uncharacterized protein YndB with AHSA1/START domain
MKTDEIAPMEAADTLRITTPSPREIVMTREFDAPRRLVFDAFTRPELLRLWLGRDGDEMTACEVDLREGGSYRYVFLLRVEEDGGERATFRETGTFREVVAPERVVSAERFDDYPDETVVATTFAERDERTTITSTQTYASGEVRDAVLAAGVESGVRESYAKLDALLRSLR